MAVAESAPRAERVPSQKSTGACPAGVAGWTNFTAVCCDASWSKCRRRYRCARLLLGPRAPRLTCCTLVLAMYVALLHLAALALWNSPCGAAVAAAAAATAREIASGGAQLDPALSD